MAWTDERLEERFNAIDQRFDEIDRRFNRMEREIVELRREMHSGFEALQQTLNRVGAGTILSLLGLIGAVLIKGA
jgi:DNA anti-recombination protein RmuC